MSKNKAMYLEDVRVGQRFSSDSYTLTSSQIIGFANQFDPQPFHIDEQAAKETFFNGLAASGWHTAAITMRLLVDCVGERFAGGLIGKGGEISWARPTRAEDTLHVESEVLEVAYSPANEEWGIVKVRNHTLNQDDKVVQTFVAQIIVPRKIA